MLNSYNQFLEKIPNWGRWLLVPIAALVSYVIFTFAAGFILIGSEEDHMFRPILIFVVQPVGASFVSTFCVYHTAPRGKLYTAIVVGGLFIVVGGWGIFFYGMVKFKFWLLVGSIASLSGALAAIFTAKTRPNL
ncbi:hypothetical protein N9777_04675 [Ascidiaceihabitans sp.]|nr:hypothetical protein [Ascidiaceihabitans sp.]